MLVVVMGISGGAVVNVNDRRLWVFDMREESEWQRGHIAGAERVDWHHVGVAVGALGVSLEQRILLYCNSGQRSKKARDILVYMGYTKVVNGESWAKAKEIVGDEILE
jgi:rhodanese-related sulfurtransferase